MYAKETDSTTENDLLCMIHRLEDKLFRKKNPYEQEKLRSVIMHYRKQLYKFRMENGLDLFGPY